MNILYLCDEYPPGRHGGIGTAIQLLAREMVKQGHKVVVAGFYDWGYGRMDYFEDEGVIVYRFRRGLSSRVLQKQDALHVRGIYLLLKKTGIFHEDIQISLKKYGFFLENIIKKYSIDIVEMPDYNDYMRFCKSYIPFPVLNVPVIEKLQGGITFFHREANQKVPPVIWKMENDLLSQADGVISVSRYTASKYEQYFSYNKPIKIIHNGIDTTIEENQAKRQWNRVIFTGTLVEKKGIYQLMKAWNIVIKEVNEANLYVFGKGPIKKITALLEPHAKDSVYFRGHVSRTELNRELSTSGIAVFPSFAESFALAPLEAIACGATVINPITTSGPELVKHNINGLLIDPFNVNDIADKIIYLLKNADICKKLGTEGRKDVKNNYDITIIAKSHEEFYHNIIKNRKK